MGEERSGTMRSELSQPSNQLTWTNLLVNGNYATYKKKLVRLYENFEKEDLPFPVKRFFPENRMFGQETLDYEQSLKKKIREFKR